MPVQAALFEPVLKEGRHQWLDVGQGGDALAEVAGWEDPVLRPQLARAAAVVRHRHDRGQVAGVLLQPAKHGGEARPATERDHPGPLLQKAIVIDDLGEGPVAAREEGAQDGLGQLVEGKEDDRKAEGPKECRAGNVRKELQCQVESDAREAETRRVHIT